MQKEKLTVDDFTEKVEGWCNRYSSYMLIGVTIEQVVEALNKLVPDGYFVDGVQTEHAVSFNGAKEDPKLIYGLTRELQCRGYADTAWDDYYIICAENGTDYDGYAAKYTDDGFSVSDTWKDEVYWDAFIDIIDPSGEVFHSGAGAVDTDVKEYYEAIVLNHCKDAHKAIGKKILPQFYTLVESGKKTFEIRKDEDNVEAGDTLFLMEWDGTQHTGRVERKEVTYVMRDIPGYGLEPGYCIISFKDAGR